MEDLVGQRKEFIGHSKCNSQLLKHFREKSIIKQFTF